jgi:hypothetical protein
MYVRWRDKISGISWYLRELDSEGSFYGDVTDTNRCQQRNFRGKVSKEQSANYVRYCELLAGKSLDCVPETEDPLFMASAGEKLSQVRFKGSWPNRLDLPAELRELLDLIHSFILPALILPPEEDRQIWSKSLCLDNANTKTL